MPGGGIRARLGRMSLQLPGPFEPFAFDLSETVIRGESGGSGPPLLLLHGYPQTHLMWHRVAASLAEQFTVVAPDLRGYGASGKPASQADHASYSKRAMAGDMLELMQQFGYPRFRVCGHDRGGRVAHRLAVDQPQAVQQLMVLDIAPTREMYARTSDAFARAYWHWFFLIRPAPYPEEAILADTDRWFRRYYRVAGGSWPFDPQVFEHYLAALRDPETIRATCEDYRAAATIDIAHDDADGEQRISCPLRVLWGSQGVIESCFDPLALWQLRAGSVTGRALPGGHYLAEEVPDILLEEMLSFFCERR